MAFYVLVVIVA